VFSGLRPRLNASRIELGEGTILHYETIRHVQHVRLGRYVRLDPLSRFHVRQLVVGDHTYSGCLLIGGGTSAVIGKYCSFANEVVITLGRGHHRPQSPSSFPFGHVPRFEDPEWTRYFDYETERDTFVEIGNDVWIGYRAIVLPNVRIGDGAIVGAGAVVNEDVPAYAIMVGAPARVVKYRFSERIIQELLMLKWWDWNDERINRNRQFLTMDLTRVESLDTRIIRE
jgi:acetyltransferase-like isoleucine patch superfamily enzyme